VYFGMKLEAQRFSNFICYRFFNPSQLWKGLWKTSVFMGKNKPGGGKLANCIFFNHEFPL